MTALRKFYSLGIFKSVPNKDFPKALLRFFRSNGGVYSKNVVFWNFDKILFLIWRVKWGL